ncbi:MAG: Na+/H+ antiporter NhaC [Flavobacteriia bacterium]|nr:MAG: Na+/H+ antiporter NhaC [Flavobacteriia bacterium]
MTKPKEFKFIHLLLPILFLVFIIGYGLVIGPHFFGIPTFPLEFIFLAAAVFTIVELFILGYKWPEIQDAIIAKLTKGFPAILILFSIGIIIGTWIISGTIPMLVYYGIKVINPDYIYFFAFIIPIIFSTLTGTSWGSIGTIGAVIIGISTVIHADPAITAGAIIGGAYFGDKMSPLSDTTNLASIATEVNLYDHIQSMTYTTFPSAIIAAIIFFIMGFVYPAENHIDSLTNITQTTDTIHSLFNFNILLIIPPLIVLIGSLKRKATLPVLITSAISAIFLGMIFQDYTLTDFIQSVLHGYNTNMAGWVKNVPENINILFNRGGLYELNEAIMFTFMVFIFIGALDIMDAMPKIVGRLFRSVKTKSGLIISTLLATAFTNAFTSNQSATSFIIGDAFKKQYDKFGIQRKVLSRSIEDYGTMIETLVPWTASTIFVVATLGVPYADYWHWQLLSLINIIVAPLLAVTGIGCFYKEKKSKRTKITDSHEKNEL